ncbi:Serine/threonine-protein kinase/endoribonuclease ire-1 [Morus notabilis]|uniref:non-specific serine/threonine protein kinase n=1 Tax=Morus notabilis TaxID=981085 RepID=W9RCP8_9ROSA|nr:Serine/threonine-protein kinase/endoribonuclease ire-1 [Morus notabilis]
MPNAASSRGIEWFGTNEHTEERATSSLEVSSDENQRQIGKKLLVLLSKEIGQGTDGTIVYEGFYENRAVAVKRILQSHIKLADKEIANLIESVRSQNIVKYHAVERDINFIYLALERCDCNLDELIQMHSTNSSQYEPVSTQHNKDGRLEKFKNKLGDVKLWKENNGRPSPLLQKLMRDMISGLVVLHNSHIVHRDLKPENILIIQESSTICAKLSDMGISRRLSENNFSLSYAATGWKAPEQLLRGQQTSAMDLFSLGCILFFCITRGRHPFGDHDECVGNIEKNIKRNMYMIEDFPEALHLISSLIRANPEQRPKANEVLHHPLFWDAEKRLSFLRDISDRVSKNSDISKVLESTADIVFDIERMCLVNVVLRWNKKVHAQIITHILTYAKEDYKFTSVRDLLRFIGDMLNHYRQLPDDIQILVGSLYEGLDDYFTRRFPKLLIEVYKIVCTHCTQEEHFKKYFN